MALLRDQVSLQHLRKVAAKLSDLDERLWAEKTLYVFNKEVHFEEPGTGRVRGALSRQYVAIPLKRVMSDVSEASRKLKDRAPDKLGKVERNRYVAHNEWVVAGTRIPIPAIRNFSEAGYSVEAILREYPSLTEADVKAALSRKAEVRGAA